MNTKNRIRVTTLTALVALFQMYAPISARAEDPRSVEGAIIEAAPEIVTFDIELAPPKPPAVPVTIGRKVAHA